MEIRKEEIKKIAEMAKINLKDSEVNCFKKELSDILNYVEKLKEVDISKANLREISSSENDFREDNSCLNIETRERLKKAGKDKNGYFQVENIN